VTSARKRGFAPDAGAKTLWVSIGINLGDFDSFYAIRYPDIIFLKIEEKDFLEIEIPGSERPEGINQSREYP